MFSGDTNVLGEHYTLVNIVPRDTSKGGHVPYTVTMALSKYRSHTSALFPFNGNWGNSVTLL